MNTAWDTEIDFHVAWRVMTRREEKAISRQEMSAETGIPADDIYRMETCNAALGALELKLFADVLGVTPQYFFVGLQPLPILPAVKRQFPKAAELAEATALVRFFMQIDDHDVRSKFAAVTRNAALNY